MIRPLAITLTVALSAWSGSDIAFADSPAGEQNLFNGKDLSGWTFFLVDKNAKMEDVWSVKDGLLVCKGKPMGYLATKQKFKNFKLIVEWRWAPGKKPGNSGVLMRITGKPKMLPNCMEAQLMNGNAGDMYGFQGFKIDGDASRRRDVKKHKLAGYLRALKKIRGNENKPGEWNRYEIIVHNDHVTLSVNGKKVNEATGCDVRAGQIGLQSEGGEIHFRKVALTPLK
ncbi:MAG: DUF1080 domain-containing protein [Planctomycetaceae bacterium]